MTDEEANYPLTCGQRWLLHLLEQERDLARPVQRIYRLGDGFDPSAFLESLEHTIVCHPALRLRLVPTEHGWRQCFPYQEIDLKGEEVQGRTLEMRATYAGMLISEHGRRTLDLENESPVRAMIVRVDGDHMLSLCVDHLAADEIAFDLFERTLASAYHQAIDGTLRLPSPSSAFSSYLCKELAQQETEQDNLRYWQQQLGDSPMTGDRNEEVHWVPATVFDHQVRGEAFASLTRFCGIHKCSLFNVMVAIQLLLMSDIGGEEDIVLNLPVSNRARVNERTIIANLSMLLHVRFLLMPGEPLSQLVLRVRDLILVAMAHRQYDYPSLSRYMAGEARRRGLSTGWLRGCNFVADNTPAIFPNILFDERLDNQRGRVYDIPRTSFTVVTRQTASTLHLLIDWDEDAWPVTAGDMEEKFQSIMKKFH